MDYQIERAQAHRLCAESGVLALPYGNAWWLVGNGVNRVVGELAGLSAADLQVWPAARR